MKFIHNSASAVALVLLFTITASAQKKKDYTPLVNTFIGTAGSGHSYPGVTLPYGMVQLNPVTGSSQNGYNYTDSTINGFTHAVYSDEAGLPHSEILFMPTIGSPELDQTKRAAVFKKKAEKASPGFYTVELAKDKIEVQLTATARAGLQSYDFPSAPKANVIIDLLYGGNIINGEIEVVNDHELKGYRISGTEANKRQTYFYAKFSKPFTAYGISIDGTMHQGQKKADGKDIKMYVQFDNPGSVLIKTGLSHVSTAGALKNLNAEIPDFDFRKVQKAARTNWADELAKIEVTGGAPPVPKQNIQGGSIYNPYGMPSAKRIQLPDFAAMKQNTFYTALYHTMLTPNIASDVDGTYSYGDNQTAKAEGFTYYDIHTLNTFGARYQLLTLFDHKRTADFIKSYQVNTDTRTALAFNELIVDALIKGIKDIDADKAFIQLRASLDVINNEGIKQYGYLPATKPASVSKTLYYSYYNWLAAQMARLLNKPQEEAAYNKYAQSWKNAFNKANGFFQSKNDGKWQEPFKPADTTAYAHGNAWQYTFFVPYDEPGLTELRGGKDSLETKLDQFFSTAAAHPADIDAYIGQYSPGYTFNAFTPYLYAFTDSPQKTQAYVNRILGQLYAPEATGLSGNDYNGQVSAWYVMSCLGFYSLTPGGQYIIGLPQFDKAVLNLPNNKKFNILNGGAAITRGNIYLQGINLDKSGYTKLYINFSDIAKGGDFEVFTGTMTNKLFMQDLEKPSSKQP